MALKFGVLHSSVSPLALSLLEHVRHLDAHGYDCLWVPLIHSDLLFDISTETHHLKLGVSCHVDDGDAASIAETIIRLHHKIPNRIYVGIDALGDRKRITTVIEKLQVILPSTIPISIQSQASPAGAQLAGTYGLGLISIAATTPGGFNALSPSWDIYQRNCGDLNADRQRWALAGPVHIAETKKAAYQQVEQGLAHWIEHVQATEKIDLIHLPSDPVKSLIANDLAVIGTPRDAIRQIKRLRKASGGFGCFLQTNHGWTDKQSTLRSDELFAQRVMPVFQ